MFGEEKDEDIDNVYNFKFIFELEHKGDDLQLKRSVFLNLIQL